MACYELEDPGSKKHIFQKLRWKNADYNSDDEADVDADMKGTSGKKKHPAKKRKKGNKKTGKKDATPKRSAEAVETCYQPGKFRQARIDFIRKLVEKEGLSWREASQRWLPSPLRASLLAGLSKSELSKRRFN